MSKTAGSFTYDVAGIDAGLINGHRNCHDHSSIGLTVAGIDAGLINGH